MPNAGSVQSISLGPDDVHSTMPTWLIFSLLILNSILLLHVEWHIWTICEIIRKGVERSVSGPCWRWTAKYLKTMAGRSAEMLNREPLYMIQDDRPLIRGIPSGNLSEEVVVAYYESTLYISERRDVWDLTCGWMLDEYVTLKITLAIIIILKRTNL